MPAVSTVGLPSRGSVRCPPQLSSSPPKQEKADSSSGSRPCCSDNAARRYHAGGGRGTRAATTALLGHGAGDGGDRVLISFEINSEKCLTLTYPVTRPISVRAGYPRADGGHLAYCFGSAGRSPPDARAPTRAAAAEPRGAARPEEGCRRPAPPQRPRGARRVPIAGNSASLLPSEGWYLGAAVPAELNSECRQPARNAIAGIR